MREKLIDVFMHIGDHIQNRDEYGICFDTDLAKAIEDVLAMLKNGVTFAEDNNVPSKWIPVTERLPEVYRLVLAVCKNGKIFVGEYVDLGWKTLWRIKTARDSTKEITQIVTHWMPLPDPPKGE